MWSIPTQCGLRRLCRTHTWIFRLREEKGKHCPINSCFLSELCFMKCWHSHNFRLHTHVCQVTSRESQGWSETQDAAETRHPVVTAAQNWLPSSSWHQEWARRWEASTEDVQDGVLWKETGSENKSLYFIPIYCLSHISIIFNSQHISTLNKTWGLTLDFKSACLKPKEHNVPPWPVSRNFYHFCAQCY